MSRISITMGSAYSKAANVNPVDGIWCSDCGWAGRVEEDMTDSEESEEPLVTRLFCNGAEAAYDAESNTFYCTLGLENGEEWPEIKLTTAKNVGGG